MGRYLTFLAYAGVAIDGGRCVDGGRNPRCTHVLSIMMIKRLQVNQPLRSTLHLLVGTFTLAVFGEKCFYSVEYHQQGTGRKSSVFNMFFSKLCQESDEFE